MLTRGRDGVGWRRRKFTFEFEREAIALPERSSRPRMPVVGEPGIHPPCCGAGGPRCTDHHPGYCRRIDRSLATNPVAFPSGQAAGIACLQQELDRTRSERDALEKRKARFVCKMVSEGANVRSASMDPACRRDGRCHDGDPHAPGPHKHNGSEEPPFVPRLPGRRSSIRPSSLSSRRSRGSAPATRHPVRVHVCEVSGVSRLRLPLEAYALPQRCPGDPSELGGERDDHGVVVRPCQQTAQPLAGRVLSFGYQG